MTVRRRIITAATCLGFLFCGIKATSQSSSEPPATTSKAAANVAAKPTGATAGKNNSSASEIAAAKSAGKVWVNTDTGVYHKGGRWYGKTKAGKKKLKETNSKEEI